MLRRNGYDEATISRGLSTRSPRVCGEAESGTRQRSLPFIHGVSEKISRILRSVGVFTAMKPQRTIRSQLVRKRPEKAKTLGAVYRRDCSDCSWCYVGETRRPVTERVKEHNRSMRNFDVQCSEVVQHAAETGHTLQFGGVSLLDREATWRGRVIKEALWTRKLGSSNHVKHDLGTLLVLLVFYVHSLFSFPLF